MAFVKAPRGAASHVAQRHVTYVVLAALFGAAQQNTANTSHQTKTHIFLTLTPWMHGHNISILWFLNFKSVINIALDSFGLAHANTSMCMYQKCSILPPPVMLMAGSILDCFPEAQTLNPDHVCRLCFVFQVIPVISTGRTRSVKEIDLSSISRMKPPDFKAFLLEKRR